MDVTFYGGPCDGEERTMTWKPRIGDPVGKSNADHVGGIYPYAGRGRFVFCETAEAEIVREYVETHRRD